jgi:hypothetical protein
MRSEIAQARLQADLQHPVSPTSPRAAPVHDLIGGSDGERVLEEASRQVDVVEMETELVADSNVGSIADCTAHSGTDVSLPFAYGLRISIL